MEHGIIEKNPVHGVRKAADKMKDRRLSEEEYNLLGTILQKAAGVKRFQVATNMIRLLALTGCRRGEIINLNWSEVDVENSCLRLIDSKEGASVRPVGLAVIDLLDSLRPEKPEGLVFPGTVEETVFSGFPKIWKDVFKNTALADITPHVLRHSFASMANDLRFTEMTIAALLGHSRGTVTSRYIHTIDTALVMAADTISGYINGLLNNVKFTREAYSLDRVSRQAALIKSVPQIAYSA